MARPPKFDREKVLWKATVLFWERGYRGVSINDLVKATGLLPGSIYAGFGNKEGLFLACLESYSDMADQLRAGFEKVSSPLACVRDFFHEMVNQSCNVEGGRGCFIVNASLECDESETAIKAKVRSCMDKGEAWLKTQLDEAQNTGELRADTDTAQLAACLMGSVFGFRVMSRAQVGPEKIETVALVMFESLMSPWQQVAA